MRPTREEEGGTRSWVEGNFNYREWNITVSTCSLGPNSVAFAGFNVKQQTKYTKPNQTKTSYTYEARRNQRKKTELTFGCSELNDLCNSRN